MKYVILIHSNPASREIWQGFSEDEQAEGYAVYAEINEDLAASREMIVSEALADPATAKQVTVRDGATITTDGPYAELKEHLAGFYLIDCDSIERAVEIAARIPEAGLGLVEVRPALDLSAYSM